MAINLENVNWNSDGYRNDVLGFLVGETERGNIVWQLDQFLGSNYYKTTIGEFTVEVTPIDYSMENKHIKLRTNNAMIDLNNSSHFKDRIIELENAITAQLYRDKFYNIFKAVNHEPKKAITEPEGQKFYPNNQHGDNIPALKKKVIKAYSDKTTEKHLDNRPPQKKKKHIKICIEMWIDKE